MEPAEAGTVLGDFEDASFIYGETKTTFHREEGEYRVRTDGPDGSLADFRVAYTFGVDPLQQYLIEMPGGRIQALSLAWDSRPRERGGQRWFHLYPGGDVDHRDVLHWTGPAQNWNHQCADCHSTNLRKGYVEAEGRFETTWSEIDVSCEACHGPGSRHVAWAGADGRDDDPTKGLVVSLARGDAAWVLEGEESTAKLQRGLAGSAEIEVCGRCHARRARIAGEDDLSQPLAESYRVALLEEGLYQADGQILDEVYEYGSFLQSRMYASGVVCSDCHEPHSAKLREEGSAACARCHLPAFYDVPEHHRHAPGSEGSRCVSCHMAARTYMVVDVRRDHSFRVPRPDLSEEIGTPNACNDCHADRSPRWAAEAIAGWFGPERSRGATWARAIDAGRRRSAGAGRALAEVIENPSTPAIVRATAVELLARSASRRALGLLERSLPDPDPLVRRAAVSALTGFGGEAALALGTRALDDPIRTVRLEALDVLADAYGDLPESARSSFERAMAEHEASQRFDADRAGAWLNRGAVRARLGRLSEAEAAYRRAIEAEPWFVPPYVNLADLHRMQGREAEGEAVLRRALERAPDASAARHALGLLLVRLGRFDEALVELEAASGGDDPRYAYVYGVALHDAGQFANSLAVLEKAHARFGGDRAILSALRGYCEEVGDAEGAARWARRLASLE
jgi:tetratricopeptide (TPR) repeat protein